MYGPTPCWRRNFTPSASPLIRLHNSASSRVRFLRNRRARSRRIQAFPSVLIPRESTIPWLEGIPLRPASRAAGFLPRGTAVERGSTAEGREGARAKRARKPPCVPCGPPDRAPSALTGHSPTPLTAMWGRNQKGLLPRGTAVERGRTAEGREGARAKRARSTTVSPLRPGGRAPGFLPRGTAVERGSTAEGREGARAKRARSTTVSP